MGTKEDKDPTTKPTHRGTVTKNDVQMDDVKEARFGAVNCATTVCLEDCGVRAKSKRKSPTVNPMAIKASLKNVFVVPEPVTPQSTVKVLQCPMGLRI